MEWDLKKKIRNHNDNWGFEQKYKQEMLSEVFRHVNMFVNENTWISLALSAMTTIALSGWGTVNAGTPG